MSHPPLTAEAGHPKPGHPGSQHPDAFSVEERYSMLAAAPAQQLTELADSILASAPPLEVIAGPEPSSTALRYPVPGTQTTTAVLGHLVLTTCTVTLDGIRGDGIRAGRDLTGAIAAAVCDAEAQRHGPREHQVLDLCRITDEQRTARARQRAGVVEATRIGDIA